MLHALCSKSHLGDCQHCRHAVQHPGRQRRGAQLQPVQRARRCRAAAAARLALAEHLRQAGRSRQAASAMKSSGQALCMQCSWMIDPPAAAANPSQQRPLEAQRTRGWKARSDACANCTGASSVGTSHSSPCVRNASFSRKSNRPCTRSPPSNTSSDCEPSSGTADCKGQAGEGSSSGGVRRDWVRGRAMPAGLLRSQPLHTSPLHSQASSTRQLPGPSPCAGWRQPAAAVPQSPARGRRSAAPAGPRWSG